QANVGPARVSASADARPSTTASASSSAFSRASAVTESSPAALEARWTDLLAQSQSPSAEAALTKLIEELARSDPQRALFLGMSHRNLHLRTLLVRAALRGWGRSQPEAAATWANAHTMLERTDAIDAVLQGAMHDPDGPMKVLQALSAKGSTH